MLVCGALTDKLQTHQDSKTKKYNMFRFSCLVLCTATVSLSTVYADEPSGQHHDDANTILSDCAIEYGVENQFIGAAIDERDVTLVNNPCFWGCILKRTGFLNDKGEYDLKGGLTYAKQFANRKDEYAAIEAVAKECESEKDTPVNDGAAGCERGVLVAACFMKLKDTLLGEGPKRKP